MKKTVLYLVVALMFVLAACGNNSEKNNQNQKLKVQKKRLKLKITTKCVARRKMVVMLKS